MFGKIREKQESFYKFLFVYLLLLAMPLVIGSFVYFEALKIVEADSKRFNTTILDQTRDILDSRLQEVEGIANQIAMNNKVLSIINIPPIQDGSKDVYKLWELNANMPQYRMTNNFIYDYYIVYKTSGIVVTSTGTYMDMSLFYEKIFKDGSKKYSFWYDSLFNSSHKYEFSAASNIKIDGNNSRMIQYFQSIPVDSINKSNGVVIVFINDAEVKNLLKNSNIGETGVTFIMNEKGEIVTSIEGDKSTIHMKDININDISMKDLKKDFLKQFPNEKPLVTISTSSYNKWSYVSVIPKSFVMEKVQYIQSITFNVMILILLLGITTAYLFAYKNAKSIQSIVRLARTLIGISKEKNIDDYGYLRTILTNLIKNKEELQIKMEKQIPLLQMGFMGRLLNGDFYDEKVINEYAFNINLEVRGESFVTFITQITGYDNFINKEILKELHIIKIIIMDILVKELKCKIYFYDMDETKMAVMLIYEDIREDKYSQLEALVKESYKKLRESNINVVFALGDIHSSIIDISTSFYEAEKALEYTVNRKVVLYKDIHSNSENYYYPLNQELKLISAVKNGEQEDVNKIIDEIFKTNFQNKQLSYDMIKQLVFQMKGTILREAENILDNNEMKFIMEDIDKSENIEIVFDNILRGHSSICDKINAQKNELKYSFMEKIKTYMYENYMNYNLNIAVTAEYFKVSEAYLYQFFKEAAGTTFSNYIEDIRIKHACELLQQELDIDIKEIATRVGYSSDASFRRAFKRSMGAVPSEYRNALRT